MLRGMSASQWLEWRVLMGLNAMMMSEDRADLRAAIVACAIWNVQIAKSAKKGTQPTFRTPQEFLPQWGDAPKAKPAMRSAKQQRADANAQFQGIKDIFASMGMKPVAQT